MPLFDAAFVLVSYVGFLVLHFGGDVPSRFWTRTLVFAVGAAILYAVAGRLAGPRPLRAAGAAVVVGAVLVAVIIVLRQVTKVPPMPVVVFASLAAILWFGVTRLILRRRAESLA